MKFNGPMYLGGGEGGHGALSEAFTTALANQNGKKSRALRASLMKGQMSKKQRRIVARHTKRIAL